MVFRLNSSIRSIRLSFFILYETKSSIEIIFKSNLLATLNKSGSLAIVPSSFIISHNTPAGLNPANLDKSTAASVCPVLLNTPPSLADKGKICPGLARLEGLVFSFTRALIVFDLSLVEIPDVTPLPIKSTEIVKAVCISSVLFETIGSSFKCLHLLDVSGTQIKPLPCVAIKFTISGDMISAGYIKSPSFSLFSSSTTIITLLFFKSSMASLIVFNFI